MWVLFICVTLHTSLMQSVVCSLSDRDVACMQAGSCMADSPSLVLCQLC
jgi:hypothetical protein